MPRFNFTNITLQSKADITDVMNNFNEIETYGITEAEVNTKIATVNGTISSLETNLSKVATTSANGLMSSTDKSKLDGIQANANNYSLPQAGYNSLGGVKSGSNVSDTTGYTPAPIVAGVPYYKDTNTTYSNATSSANGLMSSTDKSKLDTIESYANNYILPQAGYNSSTGTINSSLGGVKTTSNVSSISGYTPVPIINGVPYYKDTNTTYSEATTSLPGLMSAADKTKLNGIQANANNTTIIDNLTSTSSTDALSAKQGNELDNKISILANSLNEVLWQDETQTSRTGLQDIQIPNGIKYDFYIIYAFRNPTYNTTSVAMLVEKGKPAEIIYTDYYDNQVRVFCRPIQINNAGNLLMIEDCNINGTTNNSLLVPYKVVGFKYMN